jgi:hypothetical protein
MNPLSKNVILLHHFLNSIYKNEIDMNQTIIFGISELFTNNFSRI